MGQKIDISGSQQGTASLEDRIGTGKVGIIDVVVIVMKSKHRATSSLEGG